MRAWKKVAIGALLVSGFAAIAASTLFATKRAVLAPDIIHIQFLPAIENNGGRTTCPGEDIASGDTTSRSLLWAHDDPGTTTFIHACATGNDACTMSCGAYPNNVDISSISYEWFNHWALFAKAESTLVGLGSDSVEQENGNYASLGNASGAVYRGDCVVRTEGSDLKYMTDDTEHVNSTACTSANSCIRVCMYTVQPN